MVGKRFLIIDVTRRHEYEKYLYKCLSPIPFRKYKRRQEYLRLAISKGFSKKILIYRGEVVGQIEYAPAEFSGYPISGERIVVMNCIWVLRRVKGHNFGKLLINEIVKSEKTAYGFATIGLENHWSPWMKKCQMERLGFKPVDSMKVRHKFKHTERCFKIYLMWFPKNKDAKPPRWNKQKVLEGTYFCIAHPLYHSEKVRSSKILEEC
ncbi:MAG: hypothetical protein DRJ41_00700 [Thermoprotei archaeon]|nr:MAG: hypothetical protein DRJ41_00700 [Thermoprotei archaeon]